MEDEAIVLCDIGAFGMRALVRRTSPASPVFARPPSSGPHPDPGIPRPQSRKAEDLAVETGPERMDEAAAGKVLDDLRGFLVKETAR